MKSVIRNSCFASLLFSVSVFSGVTVESKYPLSGHVQESRQSAINSALVDASHRNNSLVVSQVSVKDFAVESSEFFVKSTSLVSSYKLVEDYVCGDFYCVTLDVEFSDVPMNDIAGSYQTVAYKFKMLNEVSYSNIEKFSEFERLVKFEVSQGFGLSEVASSDANDIRLDIDYTFTKDSVPLSKRLFGDFYRLVLAVSVTDGLSSVALSFNKDVYIDFSSQDFGDEFKSVLSDFKKALDLGLNSLSESGSYTVSNVKGNDVYFLKNSNNVGAVYVASFLDLSNESIVELPGVVISHYGNESRLKITGDLKPSYRIQSLRLVSLK